MSSHTFSRLIGSTSVYSRREALYQKNEAKFFGIEQKEIFFT